MTREEFKTRWESNDSGGGITMDEIAKCAIDWGISSSPKTRPLAEITYQVLKSAGTIDAEDWREND